jgi:GPH family glycoside/pentoside/hexuronide:cation symporter/oligogalacturonide transporter
LAVVSTASAAVCTLLPSIVLDAYNAGKIDATGFYLIVGIGFGLLFALPVVLCAIFVRERTDVAEEKKRFSVKEVVEPLGNRSFRQLVGMYLGQALCMDVFSTGVAIFAMYVTTPKGSTTVFLGIFIAVQLHAFPIINKLIKRVDVNLIYRFGLPLSIVSMMAFGIFGSNLYIAYACVFFVAVGFAGAQLTSWIMFPHVVDAGELASGKRMSGACSALMTFARKTGAAIVIAIFTEVLELTGYNADAEIQLPAARNGIKYVMAISCVVFMLLGFIMAKRYVLSRQNNEKVEKYLALQREGKLTNLTDEERAELDALKKSVS